MDLTPTFILEHAPDAALNELVALHVFGYEGVPSIFCPDYLRDLNQALRIVSHLRDQHGCLLSIYVTADSYNVEYDRYQDVVMDTHLSVALMKAGLLATLRRQPGAEALHWPNFFADVPITAKEEFQLKLDIDAKRRNR